MCVCVCMYVSDGKYIYTYLYKYIYIDVYLYVCVCVCVCVCVHMCVYVCMYVCIYVCIHVCITMMGSLETMSRLVLVLQPYVLVSSYHSCDHCFGLVLVFYHPLQH